MASPKTNRLRCRALVFAVLAAAAATAAPPPAPAPPSLCDDDGAWKMVWEDQFDTFDTAVWDVPVGTGSSFGRDANVTREDTYTENGALVLRSRQIQLASRPGGETTTNWTTGAAISKNRGPAPPGFTGKSFQYGRFCIRAKLPGAGRGRSQGLWPAHWMMPANYDEHCGYNELDILEMVNGNGDAWGTYWYWGETGGGPAGSNCSGQHTPVKAKDDAGKTTASVHLPDYYSAYHEYAVEWTPADVTYFVDSKPYRSFTNVSQLPVNPHYLMLNTAVGGAWPGAPNASTVFPAYHYIDFVRVSQKVKVAASSTAHGALGASRNAAET